MEDPRIEHPNLQTQFVRVCSYALFTPAEELPLAPNTDVV